MNTYRKARPGRLLDRVTGLVVVLGLTAAATPVSGLAAGSPLTAPVQTSISLLDLSQVGEALGRGELPVELLVAGSLVALAVGFALTLLVGTLRRRRRFAQDPDPAPAAASQDDIEARATLPWPVQDVDVFQPAQDRTEEPSPFRHERPDAPLAAQIEFAEEASESSHEAPDVTESPETRPSVAAGDSAGTLSDVPPTSQRTDAPLPAAALASIEPTLAPRADTASARSMLGTPEAPLVVELHDEREVAAGRRVGPNLPLVAAIGTVAVGLAFTAGAAVGAALGVAAGAAIGLAFAGGAGVAIGATVALLGGGRR